MASSDKERAPVSATTVARYTLVVIAIVTAALFIWQIKEALLFAFAAVIVAVFLNGLASGLRRLVPVLSHGVSLVCVGAVIVLLLGLFVLIFGSQIGEQFELLTEELPQRVTELQENLQEQRWGRFLLDDLGLEGENEQENETQDQEEGENEEQEDAGMLGGSGGMVFGAAYMAFDILATFVLILIAGVFFAARPGIYVSVITVLVPKERVERVREAMEATGNALWQWLTGQLMAMAFIGILVGVALSIIGVPLAPVLGLIAGLFNFVPYVGPLAAAVPALLLAWAEGTNVLLLTAAVFLAAQQIEGDIVTPLIQRNRVSIPPAMILVAVVGFGLVFGLPGVILATPLAVVAMVLMGMLYVEDVLDKDIEIPGQGKSE